MTSVQAHFALGLERLDRWNRCSEQVVSIRCEKQERGSEIILFPLSSSLGFGRLDYSLLGFGILPPQQRQRHTLVGDMTQSRREKAGKKPFILRARLSV